MDQAAAEAWATLLLTEFSSLTHVLQASSAVLQRLVGPQAATALTLLQELLLEALRRALYDRPLLDRHQLLVDYLHCQMAGRINERARVLHLNARNMLICDEQVAEGSVDQASISVREVARRALELGSAAIILVHNHPSGDPTPSHGDLRFTKRLVDALKPLDVVVHDHLIVAASGYRSLRAEGLM